LLKSLIFFSLKNQSQKNVLARARHVGRSGVGLRPAKGRKFFNPEKNVTFAMCFMTKNREIAKKAKCQAKCRDVGEYLGRLEGGRAGAAVGGPVVAAAQK